MLFEQLTEMIGIVIAYLQGNLLDAAVWFLPQKLPCLFHPEIDQVIDRCVTDFTLENS